MIPPPSLITSANFSQTLRKQTIPVAGTRRPLRHSDVWLDFLNLFPFNLKNVKSVLQTASIEVIQNRQLPFVSRDNHFSANFMRNPVLLAKRDQRTVALSTPGAP